MQLCNIKLEFPCTYRPTLLFRKSLNFLGVTFNFSTGVVLVNEDKPTKVTSTSRHNVYCLCETLLDEDIYYIYIFILEEQLHKTKQKPQLFLVLYKLELHRLLSSQDLQKIS